jgi:REP element-mobilizing transposase RayT
VWHLTHRCHKREFLLKFGRDRSRWVSWLFEARKRYGLSILNYVVTSNHIHLLVFSGKDRLSIPRAMQLLAGRIGQEYNSRKSRKGAFWEDRYHATAVESGEHLRRCTTYTGMNMVRAGVVAHPGEWTWGGYLEIQRRPQRYGRIDQLLLSELMGLTGPKGLAAWQEDSVRMALEKDATIYRQRCAEWTESVAVGSHEFAVGIQAKLGLGSHRRKVEETDAEGGWVLREESPPYRCNSDPENELLSEKNTLFWKLSTYEPIT